MWPRAIWGARARGSGGGTPTFLRLRCWSGIPLMVHFFFESSSRAKRISWAILTIVNVYALSLTFSRAAVLLLLLLFVSLDSGAHQKAKNGIHGFPGPVRSPHCLFCALLFAVHGFVAAHGHHHPAYRGHVFAAPVFIYQPFLGIIQKGSALGQWARHLWSPVCKKRLRHRVLPRTRGTIIALRTTRIWKYWWGQGILGLAAFLWVLAAGLVYLYRSQKILSSDKCLRSGSNSSPGLRFLAFSIESLVSEPGSSQIHLDLSRY